MSVTIEQERDDAARKAIDSLAGYKFMMFGYWAACWVHLNRLCAKPAASPFRELVLAARRLREATTPGSVIAGHRHRSD